MGIGERLAGELLGAQTEVRRPRLRDTATSGSGRCVAGACSAARSPMRTPERKGRLAETTARGAHIHAKRPPQGQRPSTRSRQWRHRRRGARRCKPTATTAAVVDAACAGAYDSLAVSAIRPGTGVCVGKLVGEPSGTCLLGKTVRNHCPFPDVDPEDIERGQWLRRWNCVDPFSGLEFQVGDQLQHHGTLARAVPYGFPLRRRGIFGPEFPRDFDEHRRVSDEPAPATAQGAARGDDELGRRGHDRAHPALRRVAPLDRPRARQGVARR
jgi:hypothetical protein